MALRFDFVIVRFLIFVFAMDGSFINVFWKIARGWADAYLSVGTTDVRFNHLIKMLTRFMHLAPNGVAGATGSDREQREIVPATPGH